MDSRCWREKARRAIPQSNLNPIFTVWEQRLNRGDNLFVSRSRRRFAASPGGLTASGCAFHATHAAAPPGAGKRRNPDPTHENHEHEIKR